MCTCKQRCIAACGACWRQACICSLCMTASAQAQGHSDPLAQLLKPDSTSREHGKSSNRAAGTSRAERTPGVLPQVCHGQQAGIEANDAAQRNLAPSAALQTACRPICRQSMAVTLDIMHTTCAGLNCQTCFAFQQLCRLAPAASTEQRHICYNT